MKPTLLIAGLALALAGCAADEPLSFHTPSGQPEAVFTRATPDAVRGWLQQACAEIGGIPETVGMAGTQCTTRLQHQEAVWTLAFFGATGSPTPERKTLIMLRAEGEDVRATLRQSWVETRNAFGGVLHRLDDMKSNRFLNGAQQRLQHLASTMPRQTAAVAR